MKNYSDRLKEMKDIIKVLEILEEQMNGKEKEVKQNYYMLDSNEEIFPLRIDLIIDDLGKAKASIDWLLNKNQFTWQYFSDRDALNELIINNPFFTRFIKDLAADNELRVNTKYIVDVYIQAEYDEAELQSLSLSNDVFIAKVG